MTKFILVVAMTAMVMLFASSAMAAMEKPVNAKQCYECHDVVKELHAGGKHKNVNCVNCHSGLKEHLADSSKRPMVDTSWEACGKCHKNQHDSFLKVNKHRPARDEKSQLTNRAPNPFWDKLMMGHGFTKEHALTRSHPFMLLDQIIVDRAAGGRFQPKNGWEYVNDKPGKIWDSIVDKEPSTGDQKVFMRQTATAVNPVCFQCKTQDHILDWPYLGDPTVGAPFSRKSKPVEMIQTKKIQHGLNCFTCHDPHSAKPRIVRDALIQALTRPEADTLWHKDPNRTNFKVYDMGMRGYTRKIAILEKYDTRLQCGQCHVEYNCNPGTDSKSGKPVTFDDPRTNHFPFKGALDLYEHYENQIKFYDFKHALTGGYLWKGQHPESESYYNSVHAKAGVGCDTCHTPKVKGKDGKMYTSHYAVTPKDNIKASCLTGKCYTGWNEKDAVYAIDSVKAYTKGKMRKAEFWLSSLIDKIVEGKKAGLDAAVIKQAQDQHLRAHILWEYWTAENSDGFHNPEMARESLTKSMDESQKGIKIINDALDAKAASAAAPAAAPAAK
ncbi:ammonia-forming cytochrome c nitrite reductase subunit c552 [Seleniivibrio woodruffii]|nr:ammonia-forming cytochrome c nitrite reductase subunit c552 [Seleniivibrio woodruffii]